MNARQVQRLTLAVAVGAILLTAVMVRRRHAAPANPRPAPALVTFELPPQPAPEMRERPFIVSHPSLSLWRSSNLTFGIRLPPDPRQRGFFQTTASPPDPRLERPRDLALIDFRVTPPSLD